jgi:hypothetical protein
LLELSDWAQAHTSKDMVFLFADAERSLDPGVFRYYARRSVFVDWKVGGQVNYLRGFGELWWNRWQAAMAKPFDASRMPEYRTLGINYLVLREPPRGCEVVFRNSKYSVVTTEGSP